MVTASKIQSPYWSLSTQGFGIIVQGINCIEQRMDIAIRTTKGSDPVDPIFGTDIYKKIDEPLLAFIPFAKNEIITALSLYVPEITVKEINHYIVNLSDVVLVIGYSVNDSDILKHLVYNVQNGILSPVNQGLVLQGMFPLNTNNNRYKTALVLNGKNIGPAIPNTGFASIEEMYAWMQNNWGYVGKWVLLPEQIILYVKDSSYTTGSLVISVINETLISKTIPALETGKKWQVVFKGSPDVDQVIADPLFFSVGSMVSWLNSNWPMYGVWSITTLPGEFDSSYDQSFGIGANVLQVLTTNYPNGSITINVI